MTTYTCEHPDCTAPATFHLHADVGEGGGYAECRCEEHRTVEEEAEEEGE